MTIDMIRIERELEDKTKLVCILYVDVFVGNQYDIFALKGGEYSNRKITAPERLGLINACLKAQKK